MCQTKPELKNKFVDCHTHTHTNQHLLQLTRLALDKKTAANMNLHIIPCMSKVQVDYVDKHKYNKNVCISP